MMPWFPTVQDLLRRWSIGARLAAGFLLAISFFGPVWLYQVGASRHLSTLQVEAAHRTEEIRSVGQVRHHLDESFTALSGSLLTRSVADARTQLGRLQASAQGDLDRVRNALPKADPLAAIFAERYTALIAHLANEILPLLEERQGTRDRFSDALLIAHIARHVDEAHAMIMEGRFGGRLSDFTVREVAPNGNPRHGFATLRAVAREDLEHLRNAVTPAESTWADAFTSRYNAYLSRLESELLPALARGASVRNDASIRALLREIDALRAAAIEPLDRLADVLQRDGFEASQSASKLRERERTLADLHAKTMATLDAVEASLTRRSSEANASVEAARRRAARVSLTIGIVGALLALGAALAIMRSITGPVAQLVRTGLDVARGSMGKPPLQRGHDEVAALASAFDTLNATLQRVLLESRGLIVAARAGRFDVRGDATGLEGGWRELVLGVNELIDAFAKTHAELKAAKETAETTSHAKSTFLSSVGHELRTPLHAILGFAQILATHENLTESQLRQIGIIHRSGVHLLTLIDDLLDVARIEAGRMELHEEPFDLQTLLHGAFDVAKVKADEKKLSFVLEGLGTLPRCVRGDERRLKQVLLNLLSNAVKYTSSGDVCLRVSYGKTATGPLRCEVVDTGAGIPAGQLGALFQRFTPIATAGKQQGTGLGLHITKNLVDLMHGHLGVESVPGAGSTFWVELALPVADGAPRVPHDLDHGIAGYAGPRRKILVVDNQDDNTAVLTSLLATLGFEITACQDGATAVRLAVEHRPDLVLLDLLMPDMTGLTVAQQLRQHEALASTRIVGVTAAVSAEECRAFAAACDDTLTKPVQANLLLEKIAAQLGLAWRTRPSASAPPADENHAATATPPEALQPGLALAQLGDMRALQAWAADLERRDPRHRAFARRVHDLARRCQIHAVLELLESRAPGGAS